MEWRPVVGLEEYADVSNEGDVRTHERYYIDRWGNKVVIPSVILKQRKNTYGYMFCNCKIYGKTYTIRIHRAVAEAFIPNIDHKPQVDHIDGNKENNEVSNLRWCTAKENTVYAIEMGLKDKAIEAFCERRKTPEFCDAVKKGKSKKTYCYDLNGTLFKVFDSVIEASDYFKVNRNSIGRACSGKSKYCCGYVFTHTPILGF